MDGDKFINTQKDILPKQNIAEDDNNFFMQSDVVGVQNHNYGQAMPVRHLNDYDSNILREDAYKDVTDEIFKLEYKIAKLEDELKTIDKQMQMANEIYDYYQAEKLNVRKLQIQEDLISLTELYKEASLSAKISGGLTSKIKEKFLLVGNVVERAAEAVISKLPGRFSSIIEIRNSLNKLEDINKSVDKLMNSSYPYGEASERYDRLSKYIVKATIIQSQISKFIK